jgi:hypothetical protein
MKGTQLVSESTYIASSRAISRTHDYSVRRTGIASWEVHFVGHNDYSFETDRRPIQKNSPLPIFTHIWVVNNQNEFLCCDCGTHQEVGLTCVHAMAIMEDCFPNWNGPTHHDVDKPQVVDGLFEKRTKTRSNTNHVGTKGASFL